MYFKTALLLFISISFVLADDSNIKEIKVELFKPCQPSEKDISDVERITHSTGKISNGKTKDLLADLKIRTVADCIVL